MALIMAGCFRPRLCCCVQVLSGNETTNQSFLILHDAGAAGNAIDALLCDAPKRPAPA